jgi:intraflagellar transport protein 80
MCIVSLFNTRYFLLVDTFLGLQVYSYEGRLICNPKYPGMRPELLSISTVSISSDVIAVKDFTDEKCKVNFNQGVYLFDITSGKPISDPIKHTQEILQISLNKSASSGRIILILDKNRDLYISKVLQPLVKKLGSMVDTFEWHDEQDLIYTLTDGKSVFWYYPTTIFVDEDILQLTRVEKDASSFGSSASCISFEGSSCIVRRSDGALVSVGHISPLPVPNT